MNQPDEPVKPDQVATEHVCVRCGQMFSVGPLLYTGKDLSASGKASSYCNACLSRPRMGRKIGALFDLLDFGMNLYWVAGAIIALILGLLAGHFGGK
jgi:hypothetical protein